MLMGFMRSSSTTPRTSHAAARFESPIPRLEEGKMCGGNTLEHMRSHPQPRNKGPKKDAMTLDKEPSAAENFSTKSTRCVKDATSAVTSSPVMLVT
jgi:hypothetical protein